jgi:hypothetical protein
VIDRTCAPHVKQAIDLASLRVGKVGRGSRPSVEQRTRVRHGFVEELGEQVIGQVVVLGDIAARLCSAIVLGTRRPHHCQVPKSLQDGWNQLGYGLSELVEQADGVVGAPVACHVGLAESDQAVAAEPASEGFWTVDHHRRQCRVGGADDRAVRIGQPHR